MKGLVGLGLVGFLAIFAYWMVIHMGSKDVGLPIGVAFGNPSGSEIEMHVVVGVAMAHIGELKKEGKLPTKWSVWIKEHFVLEDASGNTMKLERSNNSTLIKQHEIMGTQEFFIVAKLKIGQDYTLEYIPNTDEPKRYRRKFTAPEKEEKVRQLLFDPVE